MRAKTYAMACIMMGLGVGGWLVTGAQHKTALIPCIFGLFYFVFATLYKKVSLRMHVMHGAALIALLGALATARSVIQAVRWASGTLPSRPTAVISQLLMCVFSVIFLVLTIQSFIAARRGRLTS